MKVNRIPTLELMKDRSAFILLMTIGLKAKREDDFSIPDLEIGECFLNGHQSANCKNPDDYKYAIKRLKQWGFASFKRVSKGYIAKVTTEKFFNENTQNHSNFINNGIT